ncbi:unnamed protein product, partial [Amoebophrya sp. A25]
DNLLTTDLSAATSVYCATALFKPDFLASILQKLADEASQLRWCITLNRLERTPRKLEETPYFVVNNACRDSSQNPYGYWIA